MDKKKKKNFNHRLSQKVCIVQGWVKIYNIVCIGTQSKSLKEEEVTEEVAKKLNINEVRKTQETLDDGG